MSKTPCLLVVEFPFAGPWGEELTAACAGLAEAIAATPGLVWKLWIEKREEGRSGGVYLFEDEASAAAYMEIHRPRLASFGVTEVTARTYAVNEALSRINAGPVAVNVV